MASRLGVGELLLGNADRDGTWSGYDIETIRDVASAVSIPVIACGGAGSKEDLRTLFAETSASGAAIGSMSIFQKKGGGVLISVPSRTSVLPGEADG